MITTLCLLAMGAGQVVKKPPLPPPVIGVWAPLMARGGITRNYRLRINLDGTWRENAPPKTGNWIFRDGVLTLRIMQGEDLWSVEKRFTLGKDGRLTLSADRPVRLARIGKR